MGFPEVIDSMLVEERALVSDGLRLLPFVLHGVFYLANLVAF